MKSWKDQLRDLKNALRRSERDKERSEEAPKLDFEPPPAWLAGGQPTPKKPSARNPVQKSATPVAAGASAAKPSARPSALPPPPFKPRIDDGCVLNMPEWSDVGRSLQHPEHRGERSAPMAVRVGVDFGTAFTKVAIRAGVDLVPVAWSALTEDDSETGRYVVPGFVVRAPDGEFCWRRLTEGDIRGNLKLPVIEMAESDECPTATVAYLALVIRYARAFLYRNAEIGRKLVGRSLRWELNIGCPTEPHENPKVVDVFRRIVRTAWLLAAEDRLAEQDVVAAWSLADRAIDLEAEPGVVPEFVAQIAGYLGSPQVKEGLHALIDIGAATLDVATFNVVLRNDRASPPRIPIFFSAVRRLGTHYLRHNRHSRLGLDLSWNDAAPVESSDDFGHRNGKRMDEVVEVDEEFVEQVVRCIIGVIDGTRTNARGDPRSAAWREGLPIFVTGGGANCVLYRQAIEVVQREVRLRVEQRPGSSTHFRLIELNPTSGNARQIEAGDRLTVALGLTEDAENIARVVPHRDIEPITQGTRERVDHTDLYGDR
ncbi:TPA: hypothetical protein L5W85_000304 [Pseudomonas aeruginosa]|jgi:hypothetical protein|uniref:Hsp70 family protein n=6 Tax=Gammaproteobacteria TaxID=1236 RepID=A0ABY1WI59_9GAMM|nr:MULTISPECIES: hypothetical protein [Pseudomonadota]ALY88426.1 hypothetical protein HW02_04670 [Pseudomonas aeruginosa]ALY98401.1 hypothetical protein HW01_24425 [Pseudomonas aeruginosa]ALZ37671.1 hypothetical protein HW11_14900 [Pseudomonas aeruginosa]AOT36669.1 hypothetical protein BHE76_05020 [Pseudomonas aeruginosa]AXC22229.1 hypothetical protein CWE28_20175 [Pseudomonas aeruginosa]